MENDGFKQQWATEVEEREGCDETERERERERERENV